MTRGALCALALSACVADVGVSRDAIVDGELDGGDPAVVELVRAGRTECTGTVIGRRAVLTAAHCALFGVPSVRVSGRVIPALRIVEHPEFDFRTLRADVAVLVVAEDLGVDPPALAWESVRAGDAVRVVGFGKDVRGVFAKRQGMTEVFEVGAETFSVSAGSRPCNGDSGGPGLALDGRVVGVVSAGDADCAATATLTRLDPFRSFIEAELGDSTRGCSAAAGPTPDTAPLGLASLVALARAWWRGRARARARGTASSGSVDRMTAPTNLPPSALDGARVLWWAWSGAEPFFELRDTDGEVVAHVHGLAVAQYPSGRVYRFSCDEAWEVVHDMDFASADAALAGPSSHYDVRAIAWHKR